MRNAFRRFAVASSNAMGSPWMFVFSCLVVAVWGASGPYFHYSDTWQLLINTSTTVATFLMIFLVQNTLNRDTRAIHTKLDELLRATADARNEVMALEERDDAEAERIRQQVEGG